MTEAHLSADGYPIEKGGLYWDNNLRVVRVESVADFSNAYADTGETQTWHHTTGGDADSLSGHLHPYGRLARYFEGRAASAYAPGTDYNKIK